MTTHARYSVRSPLPEKAERTPVKPRFLEELSLKDIANDLKFLVEIAIRSGATEAMPIKTNQLIIDERARMKCRIPLCVGYNTNPACPPFTPTAEETRQILSKYRHGVLFRLECPSRDVFYSFEDLTAIRATLDWINKSGEIAGRVEAEAQYLGYYFAMGFKGGLCAHCGLFSADDMINFFQSNGTKQLRCNLLANRSCRHYLRVRPAMEGCGFDVFAIGKKVGWDFYVLGSEIDPVKTPHAMWMGVVLVV